MMLPVLFVAVCALGAAIGWYSRDVIFEWREQTLTFWRNAADQDLATAQQIRRQAEDMLADAEWQAVTARALTTPTGRMPTVTARLGEHWQTARDWSQAVFGADDHQGWGDELYELNRQINDRSGWPLTAHPTPLVMPSWLEPTCERLARVHMLTVVSSCQP